MTGRPTRRSEINCGRRGTMPSTPSKLYDLVQLWVNSVPSHSTLPAPLGWRELSFLAANIHRRLRADLSPRGDHSTIQAGPRRVEPFRWVKLFLRLLLSGCGVRKSVEPWPILCHISGYCDYTWLHSDSPIPHWNGSMTSLRGVNLCTSNASWLFAGREAEYQPGDHAYQMFLRIEVVFPMYGLCSGRMVSS